MYTKDNLLSLADKDLLAEFLHVSVGRVINTNIIEWKKAVPQGVSVFRCHPLKGTVEYMFTKDDKYNVRMDDKNIITEHITSYGAIEKGGLVYYLNSCMIPIISKHKQFPY